jgi:hypothetical protein
LDRDRAFYPTLLIVIASYYVLFAVMAGSAHALVVESIAMTAFAFAAVAGFKLNLWLVVGALAGHGVFDSVHSHLVTNPGVPTWWPTFCLAFDVSAGSAHPPPRSRCRVLGSDFDLTDVGGCGRSAKGSPRKPLTSPAAAVGRLVRGNTHAPRVPHAARRSRPVAEFVSTRSPIPCTEPS